MPDPAAPAPDFDGSGLAKRPVRSTKSGALATLDRDHGFPFASLVTVATDLDGSPLLLLSRLAAHTLNLERNARASILLSQGGKGDPLAHPRLTVVGTVAPPTSPASANAFSPAIPKPRSMPVRGLRVLAPRRCLGPSKRRLRPRHGAHPRRPSHRGGRL